MNKTIVFYAGGLGLMVALAAILCAGAMNPAKPPAGIDDKCAIEATGFSADIASKASNGVDAPVSAGRTVRGNCYSLVTSAEGYLMLRETMVPEGLKASTGCGDPNNPDEFCGPFYGTLRATTSRIDFIYTANPAGCWPEFLDYLHNGQSSPCAAWLVVVGGAYDRKAGLVYFDEDPFDLSTKSEGSIAQGVADVVVDLKP